jgi:hypothetical protein
MPRPGTVTTCDLWLAAYLLGVCVPDDVADRLAALAVAAPADDDRAP